MRGGGFDDLDRALLHALQVDGRAPFRLLGSVLGVSDQTVARRYARLRGAGSLRVVGLSDPAVVGDAQWVVRVRATPEAAGQVADALARRADTSWISVCSGGTEIVAAAYGVTAGPLLLDTLPRTPQVVDVEAHQVLKVFYGGAGKPFTKHGPLDEAQLARLTAELPVVGTASPSVDEVDRRLLDVLRVDGRTSVEELAVAASVSAATARRRLHDLRAGGVLRLDVDADLALFGLPVRTVLWLTVAAAQLDVAGQALAAHREVAYAAATTGEANVFATVSTRDTAALYRYLTSEIGELPGVGPVRSAPVLRHVKAATVHYGPG
ncbi:AsnC family transcriptional regulator [Amycolatopsis sp. NBC_01488]|uniref:Lrp/AsnC family transcriptional regulator n=1 Tax=Amycolatopsis sp. NBC_01488 TaxID=2903563 RepID=UPI002E2E28C6|nr:AsnC family transcriptional regulator [Amycolatopsis sp. NBC_01488]